VLAGGLGSGVIRVTPGEAGLQCGDPGFQALGHAAVVLHLSLDLGQSRLGRRGIERRGCVAVSVRVIGRGVARAIFRIGLVPALDDLRERGCGLIDPDWDRPL
jgi:hypothetical protein